MSFSRSRATGLALAIGVALPAMMVVASVPAAHAQVVNAIVVEGNARVEPETVRSYMQVQPGEVATDDNIDASVKALFRTGLFTDVRIYRRGSSLVVQVEENAIVNSVTFRGNSELDEKKLKAEVQLTERSVYTNARAQQDAQRIQALYRRSGYFNATVSPHVQQLGRGRVNIVYAINEGAETKIDSISFQGNNAFSAYSLRQVIATSESAWWKFFSTTDTYDPDRLEYDKELLRRHYLKNGFADFKVIAADAQLSPDGTNYNIVFVIEEGPQYRVGNVAVNIGGTQLDGSRLGSTIVERQGETYDASKVDKTIERITVEAGRQGYAFARTEPRIERDEVNRLLNLTYDIQEGPRVYIERIEIVGNIRTLDEVIRRELNIVEGDAFNRILIDRGRRRLTGLDFFEKIDIREEQGTAADRVIVVVEVVEKSTGTINFSAGYSTTEQVIGSISVSERNLLGTGHQASLSTALSFRRQSVDFSYTNPYFLDRNVSAGFDLYATRTDSTRESSFKTEQYGGAVRLGFRLDEYSYLNTKLQFTHRDITINNIQSASRGIREAVGTDDIGLFGITYTYSDLDHPIRPTSGYRFQVKGDFALIDGTDSWARIDASAHYFMPLMFDGVILKLEGNAGHVEALSGDKVPILDRFFMGGDSLRGFARSGIGPRMRNEFNGELDSIGAQTYAIGTVEVNFPVGLPEAFGLSGAVFTDFGTAFGAPERSTDPGCFGPADTPAGDGNCRVFDTLAFRASVGAGLIWDSPMGPLRLDIAYPILKASYDQDELIRFSVGTRF